MTELSLRFRILSVRCFFIAIMINVIASLDVMFIIENETINFGWLWFRRRAQGDGRGLDKVKVTAASCEAKIADLNEPVVPDKDVPETEISVN